MGRPLLALSLLTVLAAPGPAASVRPACTGTRAWQDLVLVHLGRYPGMDVRDALKLLQQATLGSEHWVREGDAAVWMRREWVSLGDGPEEPLVDTLGADGRFARIHLRPYRAAGGDPDALVRAFVETARSTPADTVALRCAALALEAMAREGSLPWPGDSVVSAAADWAARGYPAIHHSTAFSARYRPAYRVVAVPLVAAVLATARTGRR